MKKMLIFFGAVFVRVVLLFYGQWMDMNSVVKFTDIDYFVFLDAAKFVKEGSSPYDRATYRYSPLLSWLLVPAISDDSISFLFGLLKPVLFGKILFIAADLAVGYFIYLLLILRGVEKQAALNYSSVCWLFNPLVFTISTRGNAEAILSFLILASFYCLVTKKLLSSAIYFSLAVHMKIYPLIYALPILVVLSNNYYNSKLTSVSSISQNSFKFSLFGWINKERVIFGLVSGSFFLVLIAFFYYLYGYTFLWESYLYHIIRKDHRHNFSVYFYSIYLSYHSETGAILSILAFLPQLLLLIVIGFKYGKDLYFACFLQTFVFVTFNKVCTSQYFIWYMCFVPLILPQTKLSNIKLLSMLLLWFIGQGLWLSQAYRLEILGQNTFVNVWLCGILFFVINVWIMVQFIVGHRFVPLFESLEMKKGN